MKKPFLIDGVRFLTDVSMRCPSLMALSMLMCVASLSAVDVLLTLTSRNVWVAEGLDQARNSMPEVLSSHWRPFSSIYKYFISSYSWLSSYLPKCGGKFFPLSEASQSLFLGMEWRHCVQRCLFETHQLFFSSHYFWIVAKNNLDSVQLSLN